MHILVHRMTQFSTPLKSWDNGVWLLNFAELIWMCNPTCTFRILTSYSNDGCTADRIGYVLTQRRLTSPIEDCCSCQVVEADNNDGSKPLLPSIENENQCEILSDAIHHNSNTGRQYNKTHLNSVDNWWSNLQTTMQNSKSVQLGISSWISEKATRLSAAAKNARP